MSHTTTLIDNECAITNTQRVSRRTFLRNFGIGLALTLPLAACAPVASPTQQGGEASAPAAAESTKLQLWHQFSGDQQTGVRQVLEAFSQEDPAIQVEEVMLPGGESLRNQVMVAYAADIAPDILLLTPVPDGIDLFMRDVLEPLDDLMEVIGLNRDDFLDNVLTANLADRSSELPYQHELTGIPLTVSPVAALFNKDHINEVGGSRPETHDELIELAKVLTDAGGGPEQRSGFILGAKGARPSLVFSIMGAQWNNEGEENAEIPAAKWVRDALYEHKISKLEIPNPIELFRQGLRGKEEGKPEGSILWANSSMLHALEREGWVNFFTDKVTVPNLQVPFATTAFMQSLGLVKTSKYLDAGAKVIKFLSDEFFNILKDWPELPPRKSQLEKLERNRELWDPFINSLQEMGYNQFVGPIVTDPLFTNEFDKVWAFELEATEAIKEWNNQFSPDAPVTSSQGLPTSVTFQPVKLTSNNLSSFAETVLLSRLMQNDNVVRGCCYLCWPHWCCPSC